MAFRFNFSAQHLDDDIDANDDGEHMETDHSLDSDPTSLIPCHELDILNFAPSLSQTLQVDAVWIEPLPSPIYKRNLSDVRFQMAQEDSLEVGENEQRDDVIKLLELSEKSDLVKGVYEGGFKTWECSLDLVSYLAQTFTDDDLSHKHVIELGCGSALPTLHLLTRPLNGSKFVLQDYNKQVITHITIPNVLLNTALRAGLELTDKRAADEVDVPEALEERSSLLQGIRERCRVFAGDWGGLVERVNTPSTQRFDLILTSETIYSEVSLPKLVHVVQSLLAKPHGVALVAAKAIYFGVGGGILPFRRLIEQVTDSDGARLLVDVVMEQAGGTGVKREILRISWTN